MPRGSPVNTLNTFHGGDGKWWNPPPQFGRHVCPRQSTWRRIPQSWMRLRVIISKGQPLTTATCCLWMQPVSRRGRSAPLNSYWWGLTATAARSISGGLTNSVMLSVCCCSHAFHVLMGWFMMRSRFGVAIFPLNIIFHILPVKSASEG